MELSEGGTPRWEPPALAGRRELLKLGEKEQCYFPTLQVL